MKRKKLSTSKKKLIEETDDKNTSTSCCCLLLKLSSIKLFIVYVTIACVISSYDTLRRLRGFINQYSNNLFC